MTHEVSSVRCSELEACRIKVTNGSCVGKLVTWGNLAQLLVVYSNLAQLLAIFSNLARLEGVLMVFILCGGSV